MALHATYRRLALLLVIILATTLTVTSPIGAVVIKGLDGQWQTWTIPGWEYCYYSSTDSAWWRLNGTNRLAYQYTGGQWWDCDKFDTWRTIGGTNVSSAFLGDGAWHDLNNSWSYEYFSSTDSAWWQHNGQLRLAYQYGIGQWWDHGTNWYTIGATNVSSAFLGDGAWHDLNNSWSYEYFSSTDSAWWQHNGQLRLAYQYGIGQWWDHGTNWYTIGATNVSSAFLGDGAWHDLNNSWSYEYFSSTDSAWWQHNGQLRLAYQYGIGQWWDHGTNWYMIGATNVSSAFLGDGSLHNLGNGWSYSYNSSTDQSAWLDNGLVRFSYQYGTGQWWDYGTAWYMLGGANASSAFIGDGAWHNLSNGWSYFYNSSGDSSAWMSNGLVRFSYNYGSQQWSDYGTAWFTIGATNVSSAFIGDGAWHALSSVWSFSYDSSADTGTWRNSAVDRFKYLYGTGQWKDWSSYNNGNWINLGNPGSSSAFIGDGAWHALSSVWDFQYYSPYDWGIWRRHADGANRFRYQYSSGRWWDYGTSWNAIGATNVSSAFIGDGAWHDLNNEWSYQYISSYDRSYWRDNGIDRFSYQYDAGQWWGLGDYDQNNWQKLGTNGISSAFIGDGQQHGLGGGWVYSFDGASASWFIVNGTNIATTPQFTYNYANGQWSYTYNNWLLGSPHLSVGFVGDGMQHNLNNGWLFSYTYAGEIGSFYRDQSGTPLRFAWNGSQRQWWHYDGANGVGMVGFSDSLGTSWLTDGQVHNISSYRFSYNYGADELAFYAQQGSSLISFLKYSYATHEWDNRHALPSATWYHVRTDKQTPEIQKSWWTGTRYRIDSERWISIDCGYTTASLTVTKDGTPYGTKWVYYYIPGNWMFWRVWGDGYYPYQPPDGINVDPELYPTFGGLY